MARDDQALTIGDGSAGNNTVVDQSVFQRNPDSPIQPLGIVAFRGSFTLDGSGVGDTADCRVTFPLPGNDFYQLFAFAVSVEGGAGSGYLDNTWESYYATKPVDFGQTTQLDFPIIAGASRSPHNIGAYTTLNLANAYQNVFGSQYTQVIGGYEQSPFRLLQTGAAGGGTDPVMWLGSGADTNISSGTCRLSISFLRYSVDQYLAAPLYTGLSFR